MTIDPKTEQRCRDSFARQQAMTTIGASVLSVAPGDVELVMPFSDKLTQQHGFIHAGIVTMLVDTACGFAALSLMLASNVQGALLSLAVIALAGPLFWFLIRAMARIQMPER